MFLDVNRGPQGWWGRWLCSDVRLCLERPDADDISLTKLNNRKAISIAKSYFDDKTMIS